MTLTNYQLLLKDDRHSANHHVARHVSNEREQDSDVQKQKAIRCKTCDHVVTSQALAMEPHEHTFRNPAGYSFHVLCYSDAPGAADAGDPTTADCWFSGYAWSFALCHQCHAHLGWWYSGPDRFAGLIASRLIR